MNRNQSENQLPNPKAFALGDHLRMPDDPHLRKVATTPPVAIAQWLKDLIQATPQMILTNPPMLPILSRNNIASFAVASVETNVIRITEGPDEVHISMTFALREQPSASSKAKMICGVANVICKRQQMMVFDVQAAEVLRPIENNN